MPPAKEVVKLIKKKNNCSNITVRLISINFQIPNVCKQTFHITRVHISQKVDRVKPLIHGHINFIKFIESNKFSNVYSKICHIFVLLNIFDQI